jgi:hypothetical protein
MKLLSLAPQRNHGHALLLVLIMLGISLVVMAGLVGYSAAGSKQNARTCNYYEALAAAEAATEKTMASINADYLSVGGSYVLNHLSKYRKLVPSSSEFAGWANYDFQDLSGTSGQVEVDYNVVNNFIPLGGSYGPLKAFKDNVRVLCNAKKINTPDPVVASVYQDYELSRVPIFQYAIFYNVTLEFTPEPLMTITGPVHCNTNIYNNPATNVIFKSDITSSGTIVDGPNPGSSMPDLTGSAIYNGRHDSGVSTMSLPIGTNNSPTAVHQVIERPPVGESAISSLGAQRFYNKADIILTVSNSSVLAISGIWKSSPSIVIPDWTNFFSTNTSFYSKREGKTVRVLQIDVAKLVKWNTNNASIRPFLPSSDVSSIYVDDQRTFASTNESGVRLINGSLLPPLGLTVATASPLYIQGEYNVPAAARGTTNTTGTLGASVISDAVTILSAKWNDANGNTALSSRVATNTTVNAAMITGIVASTMTDDSGGVENLPRFLEDWSAYTLTYNGSMVVMYYSTIGTGAWKYPANSIITPSDHYNPPVRQWALDQNFQYSNKLPPQYPSLTILVRSNWRTPAAYTTNVLAGF